MATKVIAITCRSRPNSTWPVMSRHDTHDTVVSRRACGAHIPTCPSSIKITFLSKLRIWFRLHSLWNAPI